MESDQQRPPLRLEPHVKPAVIISGRRPQGGGPASHRDSHRLSDVHFMLPPNPNVSKSFRQTERDRALEKMRAAREIRIKEEQAKKAAADEAKRVAAEEARRVAIEEAKKQAAHQAESLKRAAQWPLSPDEVKQRFKRELTDFELGEVQKYKEIYYLGLGRQRKNRAKIKRSPEDNDDGMYAAEAHDHVAYRYEIVGLLGRGSFGQVFKCRDHKNHCDVAIKMLRNKKKFYRQGVVEVRLLDHLRKKDTTNDKNVIHMLDCFHFRKHICIVLELAGINLYDLLKRNAFNGFSVMAVKRFAWNILQCLCLLQREKIIHCDVKPSRYYRAPEIILGFAYDCGIDIWSFACVLAELLMGRPLFPGENEADQLSCIMEVIGLPPRRVLNSAPRARYFFDTSGNPTRTVNTRGKKRVPGTKPLQAILKTSDRRFVDFMKRCLEWDPRTRITADQLVSHEWLTGPAGRPAKDLLSFTNHTNHCTEAATMGAGYPTRDVVAELLSTNPFNDDSEVEAPYRSAAKSRDVEDDDD
ncbi:Dual specificity tyrosine-phosphorylation-regulated kinase 4 [Hypsibius exemplaris]|uniref:dual-specificity kinase n=1 Tax=Hypsibius exemplaris TaxID=2072580 RepID=A0A1W0W922_HYPEX|nr:Dual specificity tyrosine-phosphorylation-regulated kinase 4 [Hypsibius exemplaris]